MAIFNRVNGYTYHCLTKQHNPDADTYYLGLSNTAPGDETPNNPTDDATYCFFTNVTEIANAANADSLALTTTLTQVGDAANWAVSNKTVTASGGNVGPFQYVYIYNGTTDAIAGYYDAGAEVTILSGQVWNITFTGNFLVMQEA